MLTSLILAMAFALPNRKLTPGTALAVGTAQICRHGYARSARHRYDATYRRLVASVRRAYGVKGRGYRIDHLVPIELGGAPFDRANLWPQPIDESHVKDRIENAARSEVCSGRASLVDEQRAFERNWTTVR